VKNSATGGYFFAVNVLRYFNSNAIFTFFPQLRYLDQIFVLFFSNENNLGFHMRYHFFLHYGWFLKNLGKDFIRTNMHTTLTWIFVKKIA
jgi:hypothetical protein